MDTGLVKNLNQHYEQLVGHCEDGSSHVTAEDDYYQSKMVEVLLTKLLGKDAAKSIQITGSAAQHLRCISKNSKGDADVLFLSDFPKITKQQQNDAFIACQDPGFYMVRKLPSWFLFPSIQRDGIQMISASSLRHFDAVWWPKVLQLPLQAMEMIQQDGGLFSDFQKTNESVASKITWVSTYSKLGFFHDEHIQYKHILVRSYRENILPHINGTLRHEVKHLLETFIRILDVVCHYASSNAKAGLQTLQELGPDFDTGLLSFLMNYLRKKSENEVQHLDKAQVSCLIKACNYFEEIAAKEYSQQPVPRKNLEDLVQGSIDLVPAIHCEGFPQIASTWEGRVFGKAWPQHHVVAAVLKAGFQIVPKASKAPDSDPNTSFRLSFNDAEQLLALSITQFQRECFRIFKMYFYEKMDQEPKIVETYHLKTIFFWCLEENDANIWVPENRAYCCLLLLRSLALALEKMTLRHYFIPECNLFKYTNCEGAAEMKRRIDQIIQDPVASCGQTIEDIKSFYQEKNENKQAASGQFDTDQFFATSCKLFEKAAYDIMQVQEDRERPGESASKFLAMLSDAKQISVLRFCFDIILARHSQARYHEKFSLYAPLPSPVTIFVQMLMPVADELIKKVFLSSFSPDTWISRKIHDADMYMKAACFVDSESLLKILQLKNPSLTHVATPPNNVPYEDDEMD